MLFQYANVLVFLSFGVVFLIITILMGKLFRPSKYSSEKYLTYECGEDPIGSSWIQFNIRFYIIALIFVIFDVEVVFLLPWAVVFQDLGLLGFIEMLIFVGILLVGLAYVWQNGDLDWIKPRKS